MISRRAVIAGGAGAAVLGALGYRAWDRGVFSAGEGPAYEAWADWEGKSETPSRRPVHAAILAASAHNTQPWLFEPHDDSITVYADLSRNLGAADPFRRELYFSVGCAFQNLMRAAGKLGLKAVPAPHANELVPNPTAKVLPALRVLFIPREMSDSGLIDHRDDALFDVIPKRHTNRGPYLPDRAIPRDFPIFNWQTHVVAVTDRGARRELGAIIVEATQRFIVDPEMSRDSGRWFRTGHRDIERHRDGVTTETAGLSSFMTGMAKMLPDQDTHSADLYWLSGTRDVQLPTAPAFGVIFADNRLDAIETIFNGSVWQFLHLTATISGLAAQPMNAPIEIMDRDYLLGRKNDYAKEIRKIAGVAEGDPAFIFRLGYAERPAVASPRRSLDDVIIKKA